MTQNYGMTQKGEYTPDSLIAGAHPVVEIPVTIAQSAALKRGQILGTDANGKYVKITSGVDPKAILGADVDAAAQDVKSFAYVHGEFSADALIGLSDAVKAELQAIGIYAK